MSPVFLLLLLFFTRLFTPRSVSFDSLLSFFLCWRVVDISIGPRAETLLLTSNGIGGGGDDDEDDEDEVDDDDYDVDDVVSGPLMKLPARTTDGISASLLYTSKMKREIFFISFILFLKFIYFFFFSRVSTLAKMADLASQIETARKDSSYAGDIHISSFMLAVGIGCHLNRHCQRTCLFLGHCPASY